MLLVGLLNLTRSIISVALNGLGVLPWPPALFGVLADITGFGVWVLGSDLILAFTAAVVFWIVLKMSLGVIIFIWRLLPLT